MIPSESMEQEILFSWAELNLRKYPMLEDMTASLVGVKLTMGQAMKAKKMGVKKAWPDIMLAYPSNGFHGLFIELKSLKGYATKEQKDRIDRFKKNGYAAFVCRGFVEAKKAIEEYLCKS